MKGLVVWLSLAVVVWIFLNVVFVRYLPLWIIAAFLAIASAGRSAGS